MAITPGPWTWTSDEVPIDVDTFKSPGYYDNPTLRDQSGKAIVGCGGEYMPYHNPADARLIAAAPEMLALIQQLSRTTVGHGCVPLEGNDGKSGFIGDARVLLAKIEGR